MSCPRRASRTKRVAYAVRSASDHSWNQRVLMPASRRARAAMSCSTARIPSSGRNALCGVELSSPNAAWARTVASTSVSPGSSSRSRVAQSATYDRCRVRTFSRASAGSAAQSRSCTTISDLLASANVMCQSTRACSASVASVAAADRSVPTASSSSLIETSIAASSASLDGKCL